jgi:Lhr-like helicase
MSKILLIKAKRSKNPGGGTHYTYPPEYDSTKIQVLCYESLGKNNIVTARDKSTLPHEFLIGVVSNKDAPQFLVSSDIQEIQQVEANEKGRKWRPQIEKIIDQEKVMMIFAKHARGEELTQEELDVINPEKPNLGLNKSQLFDDLLLEHLE